MKNLHHVFLVVAALLIAPVAGYAQHYTQTNIDSDLVSIAPNFADAMLLNPWGLARTASSPWWLSDNGTGVSTLINGSTNAKQALVVTVQAVQTQTIGEKQTAVGKQILVTFAKQTDGSYLVDALGWSDVQL